MKVFIFTVCLVVALIFTAWAWFGGFNRVDFVVQATGGEVIVFERVTGDYARTAKITNRIYGQLLADSVMTTRGIGIFYDKPGNVAKEQMRSDVGCVLDSPDLSMLAVLSTKYGASRKLSQADLRSAEAQSLFSNYQMKTLPESNFIVTEFPWRGGLSALVGILKVYPALEKYCLENNISTYAPVTEIYDIPGRKIIYRREI